MGILFDLFGVHMAFISIILILLLAWLFWPRRYKKIGKFLIKSTGLVLLVAIILALRAYWPHSYEKEYLKNPVSDEVKATPFRTLADSIGFNIGIAMTPNSEFKDVIVKEFNSVVGNNSFKPSRLLVEPENWKFDFSKADKLIDYAEANNMRMRGHTLIWGKYPGRTYPKFWVKKVAEASDKKQALEAIMTKYIPKIKFPSHLVKIKPG